MPKLSVPEPPARHEPWAEVRAHDRVMRYRRFGVGRPVVVLHAPDDHDPFWPALLEVLGAGCRLILPELPDPEADLTAWLAGFLEGLGAARVRILAAERFALPVLELALLETDQIVGLVLVTSGPSASDMGRGTLESATGRALVPMLHVRRADPADGAVSLIADFLADGMADPS